MRNRKKPSRRSRRRSAPRHRNTVNPPRGNERQDDFTPLSDHPSTGQQHVKSNDLLQVDHGRGMGNGWRPEAPLRQDGTSVQEQHHYRDEGSSIANPRRQDNSGLFSTSTTNAANPSGANIPATTEPRREQNSRHVANSKCAAKQIARRGNRAPRVNHSQDTTRGQSSRARNRAGMPKNDHDRSHAWPADASVDENVPGTLEDDDSDDDSIPDNPEDVVKSELCLEVARFITIMQPSWDYMLATAGHIPPEVGPESLVPHLQQLHPGVNVTPQKVQRIMDLYYGSPRPPPPPAATPSGASQSHEIAAVRDVPSPPNDAAHNRDVAGVTHVTSGVTLPAPAAIPSPLPSAHPQGDTSAVLSKRPLGVAQSPAKVAAKRLEDHTVVFYLDEFGNRVEAPCVNPPETFSTLYVDDSFVAMETEPDSHELGGWWWQKDGGTSSTDHPGEEQNPFFPNSDIPPSVGHSANLDGAQNL